MPLDENLRKLKCTGLPAESTGPPTQLNGRKRLKLSSRDQPRRPKQLPHFWDNLREIRFTRGVLKEFDARVAGSRQRLSPAARSRAILPDHSSSVELKRFARHGGPNLSHLRGLSASAMNPRNRRGRKGPLNPDGYDQMRKTKPSDSQYHGKLIDIGLYPEDYIYPNEEPDPPSNMGKIMKRTAKRRASLSSTRFTEDEFQNFKREDRMLTSSEHMATGRVISIIEGKGGAHYKLGGVPFNHIEQFRTDITDANPDTYDGAIPQTIDIRVREELEEMIVPCNDSSRPAAPNFFLEAKKPGGSAYVAQLQACHDAAIGARAMNSLQNYKRAVPEYDGNAYSFSATYHDGHLKLYATYMTCPEASGEKPRYHMIQLGSFSMTHNSRAFREGASAYRNVRDLASEIRNFFIQQANQTLQDSLIRTPSSTLITDPNSMLAQLEGESAMLVDDTSRNGGNPTELTWNELGVRFRSLPSKNTTSNLDIERG